MTGTEFAARLEGQGFDFIAGVPCSLIEDLIAGLERHPRLPYVAAVREDVAVGLAGGAWLGGRRPAVLMQNSGLGTSLNALASFALMYGLPALLVVTWRGHGKDAPEHVLTGAITPALLDLLGIPHRTLTRASVDADLAWAAREMDLRMQPVALLLPEGVLSSEGGSAPLPTPPPGIAAATPPLESRRTERGLTPRISRLAAVAVAIKQLGDELVVSCNGYPSRESFSVADRPQNFYMIGSMGLASAIGLGAALARPERRTVVFDGDGNLLMNLGVLANVAALAPRNFVHIVFDNEAYGSTGNQRSVSSAVRLDRLAAAAGYRTVRAVDEADGVADAVRAGLGSDGPHFLLVKVTREEADVPRIPHPPPALRDRFRAAALQP
ncbi:MAG: phosphonopyruvate decarboxylase [Candidatus Rokubacteria bacterium]|nr:phosphonopyruvate decarboxylase [Candidatus Rokubacteria bacterium]